MNGKIAIVFCTVLSIAHAATYLLLEIPDSRREVRAAQFGGFGGFGGFSGSASQANADSQSFNHGGGFPSFPKHFGGSAANAGAQSQSFEDGGFGGFGGSAANAGAQSQSFEQVSIPSFSASQTKITFLPRIKLD
uniref:Uncharacterized protein n=1 Tax=Phlebotomus papatasi TaxID=29031 RepID=A0A1B0DF48_PHLPP